MPRKRRDGQIESTADMFNVLRNVVIWKRESATLRQVLAWVLGSNTDLGGGMNGRLKRLSLVAICQCQLYSARSKLLVKGFATDVSKLSQK